MAIYSLRLSAVGKTTQKQPFTAAAHLKYITRKAAVTHVMAARMPSVRRQAIAWLKCEERDDRKNARIIDKIVVALPRELTVAQWRELVAQFAEQLTQGRAAWFAAFHTKGKDAGNPHCHLVLRDRDHVTGRRVMFLSAGQKEAAARRQQGKSAPTTLLAVRALWAERANAALAAAGRGERIDHRSLKAQNAGRKPQVHEGPNIRAMHKRGVRARSRDRVVRTNPFRRGGRGATRVVRYGEIDRGMTRVEYNAALRQASARLADMGHGRDRGMAAQPQGLASRTVLSRVPETAVPATARAATSPPAMPASASSFLDRLARERPDLIAKPNPTQGRQRGR